jgi:hypothetical protein
MKLKLYLVVGGRDGIKLDVIIEINYSAEYK